MDIDMDLSFEDSYDYDSTQYENQRNIMWDFVLSVFWVLSISRARKRMLQLLQLNYLNFLNSTKFKSIKKYSRIIKRNQYRVKKLARVKRTPPEISAFDIYGETGIMEEDFEWLYKKLQLRMYSSRRTISRGAKFKLSSRVRLVMVLHFHREHPKYRVLAEKFQISCGSAHKEVKFLLPKIYVILQGQICWPKQLYLGWEGVSGAIDCTNHPRTRVHPFQSDYYRRDKGFMILGQIVCGLTGEIYQVDLLTGHNNDPGAFDITKTKEFLVNHQIKLLADSGYHHYLLETPDDSLPSQVNNLQKGHCSVVESVIALVKNWRITSTVFKGAPESQALCVMICYQLTAMRLRKYPIRDVETGTPVMTIDY